MVDSFGQIKIDEFNDRRMKGQIFHECDSERTLLIASGTDQILAVPKSRYCNFPIIVSHREMKLIHEGVGGII